MQIPTALTIILGLHALGSLLDGRTSGVRFERVRLAALVIVGGGLATSAAYALVGGAMVLLAIVGFVHSASLARESAAGA